MFQRWGFLLSEIWVLLLLAALLGLLAGWLFWGRRGAVQVNAGEADGLRASLEACTAKGRDQVARIAALEADVKAAQAKAHDAHLAAENIRAEAKAEVEAAKAAAAKASSAAAMAAPLMAAAPTVVKAEPKPKAAAKSKTAKVVEDKTPAKPKGLTKARDGKPDDLKLIKGIGPKLEVLCHKLGFFHFDQIANWTAREIAWVDENLEGFKGRVTRDDWVAQARDLMNGLPPRPGGEN